MNVQAYRGVTWLVVGLVLAGAYVGIVNFAIVHQPTGIVVGWEDSQFAGTWSLSNSSGTPGYVSISNGTLTVAASGTVSPGDSVAAEGFGLPRFDVTHYPYFSVAVRSSSVYLAVRIVLSSAPDQTLVIVFSTFNTPSWHTIYTNLAFLGFLGQVPVDQLTLGWIVVQKSVGPAPTVEFQNLSLVAFSGG
jgi:hypothetical protein